MRASIFIDPPAPEAGSRLAAARTPERRGYDSQGDSAVKPLGLTFFLMVNYAKRDGFSAR